MRIFFVKNGKTRYDNRSRWQEALEIALKQPDEPVIITTFRRGWSSAARPVLARGINKEEYVVKGRQAGRQIVNDQVVARLGLAIGAPVGQPEIVEISSELIEEDPSFSYLIPGTAHATIYIPNCSDDREPVQYAKQAENRERFALLCVLYGWVHAGDHQFIYQKQRPNLVHSIDHGHFFPGGPNWTEDDLVQAPRAELDQLLLRTCNFKVNSDEIQEALRRLEAVKEETIIPAVAAPPTEWGLTIDDRVTLVEYLIRRQQELLELLEI